MFEIKRSTVNLKGLLSARPANLEVIYADGSADGATYTDEYGNIAIWNGDGWEEYETVYAVRPVTIANGAQLSSEIINNVSGGVMSIYMPAVITGTSCKVKASPDGVTYSYLQSAGVDVSFSVAADKAIVLSDFIGEIAGVRFIKLEMATAQAAARAFIVTFKG